MNWQRALPLVAALITSTTSNATPLDIVGVKVGMLADEAVKAEGAVLARSKTARRSRRLQGRGVLAIGGVRVGAAWKAARLPSGLQQGELK